MPKVIENLRENILRLSKDILLREGYDALTVRGVAGALHIAVGTMYNYFPSKDYLVAAVMLSDWQEALRRMEAQCAAAPTVRDGLFAVYSELSAYQRLYESVWHGYAVTGSDKAAFRRRHAMLIEQLSAILHGLLARHGAAEGGYLDTFLAEATLTASSEQHDFSEFSAVVGRIIPNNEKESISK